FLCSSSQGTLADRLSNTRHSCNRLWSARGPSRIGIGSRYCTLGVDSSGDGSVTLLLYRSFSACSSPSICRGFELFGGGAPCERLTMRCTQLRKDSRAGWPH